MSKFNSVLHNPDFEGHLKRMFWKTLWEKEEMLVTRKKNVLENTVGIGGNAGNQHFLLFPTGVFYTMK